jgi:hypothetical protein
MTLRGSLFFLVLLGCAGPAAAQPITIEGACTKLWATCPCSPNGSISASPMRRS